MNTRTVFGTFCNPDGSGYPGEVVFHLNRSIYLSTGDIYLSRPLKVPLDSEGDFSIDLVCTDIDPIAGQAGTAVEQADPIYTCRLVPGSEKFLFRLPSGDGSPVNIAALRSS